MSVFDYESRFRALNPNVNGGHPSPHKVCLLLALMDLVADGAVASNRFRFDQKLRDSFLKQFSKYQQGSDQNNPYQPFFHLITQGFWHHQVNEEYQAEYDQMVAGHNARGPSIVSRVIEYGYLDEELFEYFRSERARKLLTLALAENLDQDRRQSLLASGRGWGWEECELIVADYFAMLEAELKGERYNKAEHNRKLRASIERSKGSVEQKHMNISAVLNDMGVVSIDGYKPLPNYQREILPDVVGAFVAKYGDLGELAENVEQHARELRLRLVDPPPPIEPIAGIRLEKPGYVPRKINYLQKHENNMLTGEAGEAFVMDFEKRRLIESGRASLADQIEQVSLSDDSLGLDIRSFEENGADRLIEVKATVVSSRFTPFFVSRNELNQSQLLADRYHLYRIYNLSYDPQLYIRSGALDSAFILSPFTYEART